MDSSAATSGATLLNPRGSIEGRIADVSTRLCDQLRQMFDAVPGARRTTTVARSFGINNATASRVLQATEAADPLAAAAHLPGPSALRVLLKGAQKQQVDDSLLAAAEAAVAEFEHLVHSELSGQPELDAILATLLPETRRRFEAANKQLIYKGNRALFGVCMKTSLSTSIMHPAAAPDQVERLMLWGTVGFRRFRPGKSLVMQHFVVADGKDVRAPFRALDGERLDGRPSQALLQRFCSKPMPDLSVRWSGERAYHTVDMEGYGPNSAVTLFGAVLPEKPISRFRPSLAPRLVGMVTEVLQPAEVLIRDTLVHESILPASGPKLSIYHMGSRGSADPNDSGRDVDRLDVTEVVEDLGVGIQHCRCAEVPEYVEMLRYCCGELGWEADKLHLFRCRVEYPIVGTQIGVCFQFPYRGEVE